MFVVAFDTGRRPVAGLNRESYPVFVKPRGCRIEEEKETKSALLETDSVNSVFYNKIETPSKYEISVSISKGNAPNDFSDFELELVRTKAGLARLKVSSAANKVNNTYEYQLNEIDHENISWKAETDKSDYDVVKITIPKNNNNN